MRTRGKIKNFKFALIPEKKKVPIPNSFSSVEEIDLFFTQYHKDFFYSDMDRLLKGPLNNIKDKAVEKHLSIKVAEERKYLQEAEKQLPKVCITKCTCFGSSGSPDKYPFKGTVKGGGFTRFISTPMGGKRR